MTQALEKLLTPRNLRAFCTVVECASMTAAAKALGLSQPVVSSLISEIEAVVGNPLIDRSRRPLRLTPIGLIVFERAKPILSQLNELYASIAAVNGNFHQSVAIGMVSSISAGTNALIKQLYEVNGDLRIVTGITPDLTLQLKRGEVNMILTMDSDQLSDQYTKIGIFHERFVLVTPTTPEYSACRSIAALATRFPFVGYTSRSVLGMSIFEYLSRKQVKPVRCFDLNTTNQVVRAVSQGMGWALSPPTCVLESGVPSEALSFRPIDSLSRRIVIVGPGEAERDIRLMQQVAAIAQDHIRTRVVTGFQGTYAWIADLFEFESPESP